MIPLLKLEEISVDVPPHPQQNAIIVMRNSSGHKLYYQWSSWVHKHLSVY